MDYHQLERNHPQMSTSTPATFFELADTLRDIALEVEMIGVEDIDVSTEFLPRGTIVKAKPVTEQLRFKPKSVWVSLGDGCYKHLTGKKGLIARHDRLDGYVDVVFNA